MTTGHPVGEWVQVASFSSRGSADVARTALEATGIDAVIHADDSGHLGALPLGFDGVTVHVPPDRWYEAREALGLPTEEPPASRTPWYLVAGVVAAAVVLAIFLALDAIG